jgi:hypothetical protein
VKHPKWKKPPGEGQHLHHHTHDLDGPDVCCWVDDDHSVWRVDLMDGVAVTWEEGLAEPIPF